MSGIHEIHIEIHNVLVRVSNVPIRDDALCNLADEDEEQDKGEEPAQVVTRKVKPGAVVDVDL